MRVELTITDEMVEQIAQRAAEIVLEHQGGQAADEWVRGAGAIADYLGCSASRIYSLNASHRLPLRKDGAALIAQRSDLDQWISEGGAKCP